MFVFVNRWCDWQQCVCVCACVCAWCYSQSTIIPFQKCHIVTTLICTNDRSRYKFGTTQLTVDWAVCYKSSLSTDPRQIQNVCTRKRRINESHFGLEWHLGTPDRKAQITLISDHYIKVTVCWSLSLSLSVCVFVYVCVWGLNYWWSTGRPTAIILTRIVF